MKNIIEYFVLFLFMIVFLWVGITYVQQNITVNNAKAYTASIVQQLQHSDFSDGVITEIISQAEEDGYEIEIDDHEFEDTKIMKRVLLTYVYRVPLIGFSKEYTIEGYVV